MRTCLSINNGSLTMKVEIPSEFQYIMIKNSILLKYSKSDNKTELSQCKKVIKSIEKKIAGSDNAKTIINELAAKYMRRPAFLDELNKIKI